MTEPKTKPTRRSVPKFIAAIDDPEKRKDCEKLLKIMQRASGEEPVIWGDSIVGFGRYHYQRRSGQKAMWPLTGFSPRKQNISIYIMPGFSNYETQLATLGKHKHSISCLYIKRLSDIDQKVLQHIVRDSVKVMRKRDHSKY